MFKSEPDIKLSQDGGGAFGNSPSGDIDYGVSRSQFLSADGSPRPAFKAALRSYGVDESEDPQQILNDMKELWWGEGRRGLLPEVRTNFRFQPEQSQEELLAAAGFIDPVKLPPLEASHALFMGGTLPWVRDRLQNLVDQWQQGVRFEKLVMLGADRPLDAKFGETLEYFLQEDWGTPAFRKGWEHDPTLPFSNEIEMMQRVWEQSVVPDEWGTTVPVIWHTSFGVDGKNPNTEQTVVDYLDANPAEDFGLVITASSQPFVHYQNLVTASVFAEKGVVAAEFLGTGAGRYSGNPDVCPEYAYLDQLIRRFEYELRFENAQNKDTNQLDTSFPASSQEPENEA